MRYKIFISSVQKEFAKERQILSDYLRKDALLGRFFDVFVFENLPATDNAPEKVYIEEVKKSDIFLLLLGKEYGYELADGVSPTQKEFEAATENNKYRLAFLLNTETSERQPKQVAFINQVSENVIYNNFSTGYELLSNVYSSLVSFLVDKGELRVEPFDKSANKDATQEDLSNEKIEWFVNRARAERNFPLTISDGKEKILTHLNLLNKKHPTNAAILLFGKEPQRFFLTSEIKCAHFHGTRVEKPIPFYQVYKGNLFELVDQAVNFVLSKIDLAVGTRAKGTAVPTAYEIPPEVIEEAIVNAVAHRDYDSTASVQVMLFKDRLEIRNPGQLPPQLSIEDLKKDHSSYPKNPLIADAFYFTRYIERMGTGILDMTSRCVEYGLPEPEFKMRDGFVTIIYRKKGLAFDKVDATGGAIGGQIGGQIANDAVTERQKEILDILNNDPYITRSQLSQKLQINNSAIFKHLDSLKKKGLIERVGGTRGYWKIVTPGDASES